MNLVEVVYTLVVVGIKDTEFWKQFTTYVPEYTKDGMLLLVSKILNSESNSQQVEKYRLFVYYSPFLDNFFTNLS